MNARFYVPYINRFLSADTIVPDPIDPQSFNRYSYVENRPTIMHDPSGHNGCGFWNFNCDTDSDDEMRGALDISLRFRLGKDVSLKLRVWDMELAIDIDCTDGCDTHISFKSSVIDEDGVVKPSDESENQLDDFGRSLEWRVARNAARVLITDRFNPSELANLAFLLNVELDAIAPPESSGHQDRVRELILHMERNNRTEELQAAVLDIFEQRAQKAKSIESTKITEAFEEILKYWTP